MPTSSSSSTMRARSFAAPRMPCNSRISPICRSIVCSGLSEVIGSWNTMVMALPRTSRRCASLAFRRSSPLKKISPDGKVADVAPSRRTIESAVTDLPEPDSPTSASVRPRCSLNETRSTASAAVPPCTKATERSRTSRRGVSDIQVPDQFAYASFVRIQPLHSNRKFLRVMIARHEKSTAGLNCGHDMNGVGEPMTRDAPQLRRLV